MSDSSNNSVLPEKSIEKIKKAIHDGRFINVDLIADTLVDEYSKLSK
jgi:anti-sigma28 factor (negative regulator of flagellin synthesis)